eukprot:10460-Heterococcus_DN1.PRE.1
MYSAHTYGLQNSSSSICVRWRSSVMCSRWSNNSAAAAIAAAVNAQCEAAYCEITLPRHANELQYAQHVL